MAFVERKNILYVGGLDDAVSEEILHAAFIPFGDLKSIHIHRDASTNKSKGYAFVEYEDVQDASDAIENMDGGELYGKVLRCNVAKAVSKLAPGKAVWSSDEYAQQKEANQDGEEDNIADLKLIPEKNPLMVEDDDRDADAE